MADQNVTDLTAQTTWSADDLIYVVDDPAGTPADRKMTLDDLFTEIVTGVVVKTANGIDITPGSDTDADLVTVNVTGTPKLWWDESESAIVCSSMFHSNGNFAVGGAPNTSYIAYIAGAVGVDDVRGVNIVFTNTAANTSGIKETSGSTGTGNITSLNGIWSNTNHASSGTLGNAYNFRASFGANGGVTSSRAGVLVLDATGSGSITTQYGLRVTAMSKATTNWAIHVGTNDCHFEGAHEFINSSAPSGVTDGAHLYAADQAAGNSCIHARTEGGAVLKLFQGAAIADAGAGEAETQLNLLLSHLRAMGVIAT